MVPMPSTDKIAVLPIRGLRYYGVLKAREAGHLVVGAGLKLVCQPHNPHDSNAVSIAISVSGEMLGYVPREVAGEYSAALRKGLVRQARIHSVGSGGTTGNRRPAVSIMVTVACEEPAPHRPSRNGAARNDPPVSLLSRLSKLLFG
jgi:hypothetical protein